MTSGNIQSVLIALIVIGLIAFRLLNLNHGLGRLIVRYSPTSLQSRFSRWHRWLDGTKSRTDKRQ
jgi:hypothetical protein